MVGNRTTLQTPVTNPTSGMRLRSSIALDLTRAGGNFRCRTTCSIGGVGRLGDDHAPRPRRESDTLSTWNSPQFEDAADLGAGEIPPSTTCRSERSVRSQPSADGALDTRQPALIEREKLEVPRCRKKQRLNHFADKDIPRAAYLPCSPRKTPRSPPISRRSRVGEKLSPVLLVQGVPLWVADGYHRICASYHLDEQSEVPCRVVPRKP
jgi:hypothetical protein